ncbi:unnamed protein product [Rotaria sp. Silwood2]|nr:unnamed protein product [Rotaria sp. Silwood2]CAF4759230.1 unnamed protein product [Rotaria sp. Silwood2]
MQNCNQEISLFHSNLHLQTLQGFSNNNEQETDSSDDSEIEVTSEIDDRENHIINFNTYLNIKPDYDEKDDELNDNTTSTSSATITTIDDKQSSSNTSDDEIEIKTGSGGVKQKNGNNKSLTAQQNHCTRFILSQWQKQKEELLLLSKQNYGGGVKLHYPDLDQKLLQWFREHRGIIKQPDETIIIRKEKVSFKQLQRRGKQISIELNHKPSSSKWYGRFLRRHGLSLPKPKRHKKIPLNEVHKLVQEFHSYLRRSSRWGLKRGPMGAFTPKDVCNMDESPLSLFGDQSKLSVNAINTCNEIEGHISNKRFCTVILTVFGEDNSRIGPVLLFKGKAKISENEKKQYATDVKVFFSPKAVNNRETMDKYINYWISKIKDNKPKLFITDSSSTHLNDETLRLLRKDNVVVAIIPKGCTMYIQTLDVFVFSVFKHHYYECSEEFIEKYGPRSKIKLSASQSRILCARLTSSAWKRTLTSIDTKRAFTDLGYIWTDNSLVQPRGLPGYSFDPAIVDYSSTNPQLDEDNIIEAEAKKVQQQHLAKLNKQNNKQ